MIQSILHASVPVTIYLLWRADFDCASSIFAVLILLGVFAASRFLKIEAIGVQTKHQDSSQTSKHLTAFRLDADREVRFMPPSTRLRKKRIQLDEPEPPSNAALKETMVGTIQSLEAGWIGLSPVLDDGALKVWHRPEVRLRINPIP